MPLIFACFFYLYKLHPVLAGPQFQWRINLLIQQHGKIQLCSLFQHSEIAQIKEELGAETCETGGKPQGKFWRRKGWGLRKEWQFGQCKKAYGVKEC